MNRRNFLLNTAAATSLPFWLQSCDYSSKSDNFPITVHSDQKTGHLMREAIRWGKGKTFETETPDRFNNGSGIGSPIGQSTQSDR